MAAVWSALLHILSRVTAFYCSTGPASLIHRAMFCFMGSNDVLPTGEAFGAENSHSCHFFLLSGDRS